MKIYIVEYESEDCRKVYGYFSTKEKAVECKNNLIINCDDDMKEYYKREIDIYETTLDVFLRDKV